MDVGIEILAVLNLNGIMMVLFQFLIHFKEGRISFIEHININMHSSIILILVHLPETSFQFHHIQLKSRCINKFIINFKLIVPNCFCVHKKSINYFFTFKTILSIIISIFLKDLLKINQICHSSNPNLVIYLSLILNNAVYGERTMFVIIYSVRT